MAKCLRRTCSAWMSKTKKVFMQKSIFIRNFSRFTLPFCSVTRELILRGYVQHPSLKENCPRALSFSEKNVPKTVFNQMQSEWTRSKKKWSTLIKFIFLNFIKYEIKWSEFLNVKANASQSMHKLPKYLPCSLPWCNVYGPVQIIKCFHSLNAPSFKWMESLKKSQRSDLIISSAMDASPKINDSTFNENISQSRFNHICSALTAYPAPNPLHTLHTNIDGVQPNQVQII